MDICIRKTYKDMYTLSMHEGTHAIQVGLMDLRPFPTLPIMSLCYSEDKRILSSTEKTQEKEQKLMHTCIHLFLP